MAGVKRVASVTIGAQEWMAKNLDVTAFANGDAITVAKTKADWARATRGRTPVRADVGYDRANGKTLGKVYSWFAVMDPRGLAPDGWRIPTESDWLALSAHIDGKTYKGKKRRPGWIRLNMSQAGIVLKSRCGWPETWQTGTDETGFGGLPAGMCSPAGEFHGGADSEDLGPGDMQSDATAAWWAQSRQGEVWFELQALNDALLVNRLVGHGWGAPVRCVRSP